MLTNAYDELEEFMAGYGKSISDIEWAAVGDRAINIDGVLLRCESTFYYTINHIGSLNPKLVLAGNGFTITRGEDETSGECWAFHSHLTKPMFKTTDYSIWTGAPGGDSEKAKRLKIYVAGPYTAGTMYNIERNVRTAIDVGLALFNKGHFPFIPHLTHYVDIRGKECNNAPTWEEYMMRDLAWLEVADALFFMGESKGADMELEAARTHGLEIYYTLSEVPDVCGTPFKTEEVTE